MIATILVGRYEIVFENSPTFIRKRFVDCYNQSIFLIQLKSNEDNPLAFTNNLEISMFVNELLKET